MGTTGKEDQWHRKCHVDRQGRPIKNAFGQTKGHQREECSFCSQGTKSRETYIMIGVPSCVTEELLRQDNEILETSRMTTWNMEKQKSEPTDMAMVVRVGKHHPSDLLEAMGVKI